MLGRLSSLARRKNISAAIDGHVVRNFSSSTFRCVQDLETDDSAMQDELLNQATEPNILEPEGLFQTFLQGVHDNTGLPWWGTLALTAASIRLALLPITVKGQHALGSVASSFRSASREMKDLDKIPKASDNTIRSSSAKSMAVAKRAREILRLSGAPSPAWIIASPAVNISVLFYGLYSVRHMAAVSWPGFESEGPFWAADLTLPAVDLASMTAPLGMQGVIMPASLVMTLHLTFSRLRQLSMETPSTAQDSEQQKVARWLLSNVAALLELMTIPVLIGSLTSPQAPLYYWTFGLATSLLLQQLAPTGRPAQTLSTKEPLSPEAIKLFSKAAGCQAAKQHKEASSLLHQVLLLHPHTPNALFALGQVHAAQQQWEESYNYYMKAAEGHNVDPTLRFRAWFAAGIASSQSSQDWSESASIDAFSRASDRSNPTTSLRVRALVSLATIYKRLGDRKAALTALEEASTLDPKVKEAYLLPMQGLQD
eukprot:jgi/Picsp_1/2444/NSC_05905-R1_cytochrome oxidase biogenesis family